VSGLDAKREVPALYLITGIMASGKSSVAERLAGRLGRSVHLRGDVFRRMIVSGRSEMTPAAGGEALQQLRLRYRAAAAAARVYAGAGFSVVYQDVILGRLLAEVVAYHRHRPMHVVVLCPRADVVAEREAKRAKRGYGAFSIEQLDRVLRSETPRLGLWLDTSELDIDQTVDRILRDREAASVAIDPASDP
jgi:predicted kinase